MTFTIPENAMVFVISGELCNAQDFAKKYFSKHKIFLLNKGNLIECIFEIKKNLSKNLLTLVCCHPDNSIVTQLLQLTKEFYLKPISYVLRFGTECESKKKLPGVKLLKSFSELKHVKRLFKNYGFTFTYVFNSWNEVDQLQSIKTINLSINKKDNKGPFDIIGDIHGCFDELIELLTKLDYIIKYTDEGYPNFGYKVTTTSNRKVIFLGDIVDRGPEIDKTLRLVMSMVNDGIALCIIGNHDEKLLRKLVGRNVKVRYGLEQSVEQLKEESNDFIEEVINFLNTLPYHLILDEGKLIVSHAGITEKMQGKISEKVNQFCLYGEQDDSEHSSHNGFRWAEEYHGDPLIVFAHITVKEPRQINNTIDIDTGCVHGWKLTALRYPERELVAVDAKKVYYI